MKEIKIEDFDNINPHDVDKMRSILDNMVSAVDDLYCFGRIWPVNEYKPLNRLEIEREFAYIGVCKFYDVDNYNELLEYQCTHGIVLFTLALKTSLIKKELDLLYKND